MLERSRLDPLTTRVRQLDLRERGLDALREREAERRRRRTDRRPDARLGVFQEGVAVGHPGQEQRQHGDGPRHARFHDLLVPGIGVGGAIPPIGCQRLHGKMSSMNRSTMNTTPQSSSSWAAWFSGKRPATPSSTKRSM